MMIIKIKNKVGGNMRRPLLLVFIFLLFLSFVYTKDKSLDNIKDKENITIEGIVKEKIEKNKLEYWKIEKYNIPLHSQSLKRIKVPWPSG